VSVAAERELVQLANDYRGLAAHYREQQKDTEADALELVELMLRQAVHLIGKTKGCG
jgi:hypothetical protein